MSIAIINGSPKKKKSATNVLLQIFNKELDQDKNIFYGLTEETKESLIKSDVWIIAFPLYVDGIPSNMIQIMRDIDNLKIGNSNKKIYAIVNCGFHEGRQSKTALKVVKNWCERCGCEYAGGIGAGGCGFLADLSSTFLYKPLTRRLRKNIKILSENINKKMSFKNIFTSISLPRWLYLNYLNLGWLYMIKTGKVVIQK